MLTRSEVVLQLSRWDARLGRDLSQRHGLQATSRGQSPDGPGDPVPAFLVIDLSWQGGSLVGMGKWCDRTKPCYGSIEPKNRR
ncbi:hypothetical protein Are01nite_46850 [Actinoplanes regularis]|nr:hypothetical protein Are01nite_46850 [Actinoplanes regularis]